MIRNTEDWIIEYKKRNAYWLHDGNPRRPHALLTSGMHSNGFFNSRLVIQDEALLREAADELYEQYHLHHGRLVSGIVGPQTGATKLAEFIADYATKVTGTGRFFASPAKDEKDGVKSMVFSEKELELLFCQTILLCEDVLTTGSSVDLTATAVAQAGGVVSPFIIVLVNRSGFKMVSDKYIIALIDQPMPMWMPEKCPLCKEGSEALRPKGKEEWARLNAEY